MSGNEPGQLTLARPRHLRYVERAGGVESLEEAVMADKRATPEAPQEAQKDAQTEAQKDAEADRRKKRATPTIDLTATEFAAETAGECDSAA